MIPKVIHYCWFGGNPLPELAQQCLESWKKHLPDYEIKEWNESNFDLNCCNYVKEAYEAKKWAFVSDYARFQILYEHGGLYFDTDVELIKSMDDLLVEGSFIGCEPASKDLMKKRPNIKEVANPGLGMAAEPGLDLYKWILEDYERDHFILPEKGMPQTVVERTTKVLLRNGCTFENLPQHIQNVTVYPSEYFCPINYNTGETNITEQTRSIHHYTASWVSDTDKKVIRIMQSYAAKGKEGCMAERLHTLPLRMWNKIERLGLLGTIRFLIKRQWKNKKSD